MNLKEKLNKLRDVRASIKDKIESGVYNEGVFLCHEYEGNMKKLPELIDEITVTGRKYDPHYFFPCAICYDELDDGRKHDFGYWLLYAKKKLELVSRVRQQLTKGKY